MTGNRTHLEDYQELSKVGSVTFGGSKDDDEMPEIRIYDKSSEGIFEKASYDND
ncbi:hypothetical protein Tco_0669519, partial [Tanacetum coccineum]